MYTFCRQCRCKFRDYLKLKDNEHLLDLDAKHTEEYIIFPGGQYGDLHIVVTCAALSRVVNIRRIL